jgi:DNA-binding MarR family transcriptional regulator
MKQKHVGFLLKLINDRMTNKFNKLLKERHITAKQLQIVEFLKANEERMVTQKDLEIAFGVSHPTISRMLKEMEKNGFIHTHFNPKNRTMKIIEYDIEKFHEAEEHRNAVEDVLSGGFTPEERAQLLQYLERVYRNIEYLP